MVDFLFVSSSRDTATCMHYSLLSTKFIIIMKTLHCTLLVVAWWLLAFGAQAQAPTPPQTIVDRIRPDNPVVNRVYYDDEIAVYFGEGMDPSVDWMNDYIKQVWQYIKQTYGSFGPDPRIYVVAHANPDYNYATINNRFDAGFGYRNVIDLGGSWDWANPEQVNYEVITHELAHIVEGGSKNTKESPSFEFWADGPWPEIFIYDAYQAIGKDAWAKDWFDRMQRNKGGHYGQGRDYYFFRDWFYPIYDQYGGADVLNKYFTLLSENFPKKDITVEYGETAKEYSRRATFGEVLHFMSAAAGTDLQDQYTKAFGWNSQREAELNEARQQFPLSYDKDPDEPDTPDEPEDPNEGQDITDLEGRISAQYSDSPTGEEVGKVIDNDTNTKYLTFNPSGWVQFQANQAYAVNSYTLTAANDFEERDPISWTLEGSNDGSTWSLLNRQSGQNFARRFEKKTYAVDRTRAYEYFRLQMKNNEGDILQLAEWELMASPDVVQQEEEEEEEGGGQLVQAEDYSSMKGIRVEATKDTGGGQNVGYIDQGDELNYDDITLAESGEYTLEYRVSSRRGDSFDMRANGQKLGTVEIAKTGGWQDWTTVSQTVTLDAGTYDFSILANSGEWNINWWKITYTGTEENGGWEGFEFPEVVFDNQAEGTEGSDILLEALPNIAEVMRQTCLDVCQKIYVDNNDQRVNFDKLTLILEDTDGVAYKFGSPPAITIGVSGRHLANVYRNSGNSYQAVARELRGILAHEGTHGYQWEPKNAGGYQSGTEFFGFIEGLADYVRISTTQFEPERFPSTGGSWTSGYTTSGFFIDWIVQNKDEDFAIKFNRTALDYDTWSWDRACRNIVGQGVQALWDEYQASLSGSATARTASATSPAPYQLECRRVAGGEVAEPETEQLLYPNPARDVVRIKATDGNPVTSVSLVGTGAMKDLPVTYTQQGTQISVSALPPGTHLLLIERTNGRKEYQRLHKE